MRGTKYEARREGVRETPGLYKVLLSLLDFTGGKRKFLHKDRLCYEEMLVSVREIREIIILN